MGAIPRGPRWRNRSLDQPLIHVEDVSSRIVDKHRDRAAQHESVRGGYESVGRHNDLCRRFLRSSKRGQIQRGRAGMMQQRPGAAGPLFKPLMAAAREGAVAGKMVVALRFGRINELVARRVRPESLPRRVCRERGRTHESKYLFPKATRVCGRSQTNIMPLSPKMSCSRDLQRVRHPDHVSNATIPPTRE